MTRISEWSAACATQPFAPRRSSDRATCLGQQLKNGWTSFIPRIILGSAFVAAAKDQKGLHQSGLVDGRDKPRGEIPGVIKPFKNEPAPT